MSAAVSVPRISLDDDLEDLYEQVWAVFSEDDPAPNPEKDLVQNVYQDHQIARSPVLSSPPPGAYRANPSC